jgi:nitrile hydratase beta subunit
VTYTTHADLGGRLGFGRVIPEPEGELFHASWEPGVLALVLAMGATGAWNIDMSRAARETLPDYDRLSYYEIWFAAMVKLLAERHLVEADEAASGRALHAAPPLERRLVAADVAAVLAKGSPTLRPVERPARYRVGDSVRMYAGAVPHHTRLPGYVRGKRGVVERVHGVHVFADAHALGLGEQPHWLYGVVFDGSELWPGDASATRLKVGVDAWEPYLAPA